jgi:hypothetical protein
MEPYALPHGAKGIEGDGFAVEFRGDKIVFVPKADANAMHYTLHAGPNSGVIDLHETSSDGEDHRTLFAVRKDDLIGLLPEMASVVPELLNLLRPLGLGWLKHRNIGIARGIEPLSDSDIAAVTRKRKRRLVLDPELYSQNVNCPEFLEDVYDFPDGNFTLLHRGRAIGIGFKHTDPQENIRLFWIKRSDLLRFGNDWQRRLVAALQRIAIPPDRYSEYSFLRV